MSKRIARMGIKKDAAYAERQREAFRRATEDVEIHRDDQYLETGNFYIETQKDVNGKLRDSGIRTTTKTYWAIGWCEPTAASVNGEGRIPEDGSGEREPVTAWLIVPVAELRKLVKHAKPTQGGDYNNTCGALVRGEDIMRLPQIKNGEYSKKKTPSDNPK